jgi:hypothetical protein
MYVIGKGTSNELYRYQKLKIRSKTISADINFLKNCEQSNVCPKFIKITTRTHNMRALNAIKMAQKQWLHSEIKYHYSKIENIRYEIYNLHLKISKSLNNIEHEQWLVFKGEVEMIATKTFIEKSQRLKNKISKLKQNQCNNNKKQVRKIQTPNFVTNLSTKTFNDDEMKLLNKGLSFKPPPKLIPTQDIIADIETAIERLPIPEKESIRYECDKILEQHLPKKEKLTRKPTHNDQIIKHLKSKQCFYVNPDKGKGIVILDKTDYEDRMKTLISSGPYQLIENRSNVNSNPIDRMQKDVKERFALIKENYSLNLSSKLSVSNPQIPRMYGQVKLHKPGKTMRPVVSNINAPTSRISKWLVTEFENLNIWRGFSVKNTNEFVKKVKTITLKEDEILASFDVVALYPSVPIPEALKVIADWLHHQNISDDLASTYYELTNLCMDQTQFQMGGKYYEQQFGTAMGNSLSPFVANMFMANLEHKIQNEPWFPRIWYRYVDDIFVVVKRDEVDYVLQKINAIYSSINFTVETEEDNSLPFLDVKLTRCEGRIKFDIYRKPTSSQQYITEDSFHPRCHKMAAFHSMLHRLVSTPLEDTEYRKELNYIIDTAIINGYDEKSIKKLHKKHKTRQHINNYTTLEQIQPENDKKYFEMTYYPEITEKMEKIFNKHDLKPAYNSNGKLGDLLGNTKDKIEKDDRSGIYEVGCQDCPAKYIGQTRRKIKVRHREHKDHQRLNHPQLSAIAEHAIENNHTVGDIELLKEVRKPWKLNSYESMYIFKNKNQSNDLVNREDGKINSILFKYI